MLSKLIQSRIHFIGIGGIGMAGLAQLLHSLGAHVQGSDIAENQQTQFLRSLGVLVFQGHKPQHVFESDVVVFSSAIDSNNVELKEARRLKIPLIPRAEALDEVMRLKRGIAVAGSHGKTTTTALTAAAFLEAGANPTVVVGGRLDLFKSTALVGDGEWFIAEADESDGRLLRLNPEIIVITNIDNDHLDHFGSFENLKKAFYEFALKIPFYGTAILCGDDPLIREVFSQFPKRVIYYGFNKENDLVLEGQKGIYSYYCGQDKLGGFQLALPGRHNALNALAALAVCRETGLPQARAIRGIERFQGVDRRFQKMGSAGNIDVYNDYAHHPTEIRAVLSGAKERFPQRRIVVLFQPHRYSRTKNCWNEFLNCFQEADEVFLADIYGFGESPIPGTDGKSLAQQIAQPKAHYLAENEIDEIYKKLQPGDVLLLLGAGDIWRRGERLLVHLAGSCKS